MEEFIPQPSIQEGRNSSDTYNRLLEQIREIYGNFVLDSGDMETAFNEKYKDAGTVQLLNEEGEALKDKVGNRVSPIEFSEIGGHSKQAHMRGLLYKLTLNPVGLLDNLSKERALLRVLKVNGVDLGPLINACQKED